MAELFEIFLRNKKASWHRFSTHLVNINSYHRVSYSRYILFQSLKTNTVHPVPQEVLTTACLYPRKQRNRLDYAKRVLHAAALTLIVEFI